MRNRSETRGYGEPGEPGQSLVARTLKRVNGIFGEVYPQLPQLSLDDISVLSDSKFKNTVQNVQMSIFHPVYWQILQKAAKRSRVQLVLAPDSSEMWGSFSKEKVYVRESFLNEIKEDPKDIFRIGSQLAEHSVSLGASPVIYDNPKARNFIPILLSNMQNERGISELLDQKEKDRLTKLAYQEQAHILVRGASMRVIAKGKVLGPVFDVIPEGVIISFLARPIKVALAEQLISEYSPGEEVAEELRERAIESNIIDSMTAIVVEPVLLTQLASVGISGRTAIMKKYLVGDIPARFYEFR